MNTQSFTAQSIQNLYANQYRAFRLFGNIGLWLVIYFVLIRGPFARIITDNEQVTTIATVGVFVQTILLHYFIGFYVFPTYVYKRSYGKALLFLLICFFITYQTNYLLFYYLDALSAAGHQDGEIRYVRKIFAMLQNAGWLGCFTNLRVSLWNLSYNFFLPVLTVAFKAVTDIISYQRKLVIAERDKFALELNFLKAQVNPHFLFNTLNSVYSRIFDVDEQAADLILRLSELMRYNLYETDLPKIALDKELAYIQNYLALERNRLADQPIVIDYEQSGQPETNQIAPLLLIAFVENAFKHGIRGATAPAYIQVSADVAENQLVFRVENSIPARWVSAAEGKKSGGIGLVNVRKRLDALYQNQYTLTITPSESMYQITLTIQLGSLL